MSQVVVLLLCLAWFVMGFCAHELVMDWREWWPFVCRRCGDPGRPERYGPLRTEEELWRDAGFYR
jgi:hypothetical protein